MAKYRIGEILTSNKETIIEKALSGEKVIIPKGNKVIVGADRFVYHLQTGFIQPLGKDAIVDGYDVSGLAKYLLMGLEKQFGIEELLDTYNISKSEFIEEIENCLRDIGF